MMYTNIETYYKENFVPIYELMLGVDTVHVDDEGPIMGLSQRSKDFLNIKSIRQIKDFKDAYNVLDHEGASK